MKRGFLTTERAKRTLEKEYPTKRQALSTLPGDEAQSTTTAVAADVHANTSISHGAQPPIVPPAVCTAEGSDGDAGMSSQLEAESIVLTDTRASQDVDISESICRPIDADDATHVTHTDEKAPDSDGDVDMPPVTVDKIEHTTGEKSHDDQPPITDAKSEQATNTSKDAEPATTTNNKDDEDGPVHIRGVHYVDSNTDLHSVPSFAFGTHSSSIIHDQKKRAVFRVWPRDPKGKVIIPNETLRGGKVAPNGILSWGATLYDFYSIKPIPDNPYAITYLSGSRIAAAVRKIGELEHAKDELEWADNEDDPHEIPVANTGELVECYETRARLFKAYSAVETKVDASTAGVSSFSSAHESSKEHATKEDEEENGDEDGDEDGDEKMETNEQEKPNYGISSVLMFDRPLSSPFHPSYYPPPWPFIPFANPYPPVLLQERIPVHLLPKTLYVHDPYSLLPVDPDRDTDNDETPWINMRPRVYLYKLSLESSTLKAIEESRKAAEESEKKKKRILDVYRFLPTEEERARGEPAYEVALPTKPSAPTCVEEAHLYLSPVGKLGKGNHSMVYKAEWELPRELFMEPKLCHTCVQEALMMQVYMLKWSGRWREMMQEAGCKVPPATGDEGGIKDTKYEMPVPPDTDEEFDAERIIVLKPQSNSRQKQTTPSSTSDSEGLPVFRVYCPNLRWQTPSTRCSHFTFHTNRPVPRTSVFQVAAKLSIQHDTHLAREAQNYQAFPDHFFQHWNGYNLIRPIHNPVPLHALVPQFYGYYVPVEEVALSTPSNENAMNVDKEKATAEAATEAMHTDKVPDENASKRRPPPYLSPILLLEHCGQPVHLSSLSEDDREECASLFLRFNQAEWLHESIALRNVLIQPGLPIQWPIERDISESDVETQKSFRLIDFGPSRKISSPGEWEALRLGKGETEEALQLVKILHGAFL
ncbi:hypothetical protein F5141DRAFT_273012 [Pisolithus sp. B1]|nr:hypothetical protein F5141DRAFT_273012 [Pisolithus sp. B1]